MKNAIISVRFLYIFLPFEAVIIFLYAAINECGLVYDGGLVVGPAFETNDPHVYGAGTCAKYSRRLYASSRAHRHYCSEDVGEAVQWISHLFFLLRFP